MVEDGLKNAASTGTLHQLCNSICESSLYTRVAMCAVEDLSLMAFSVFYDNLQGLWWLEFTIREEGNLGL